MTNQINPYDAVRPISITKRHGIVSQGKTQSRKGCLFFKLFFASELPVFHLCGGVASAIVRSLSDSNFDTDYFRFLWSNNIVSI